MPDQLVIYFLSSPPYVFDPGTVPDETFVGCRNLGDHFLTAPGLQYQMIVSVLLVLYGDDASLDPPNRDFSYSSANVSELRWIRLCILQTLGSRQAYQFLGGGF